MNDPTDFISRSMVSDCCGAPILAPDFCSECKEHCGAVEDGPEPGEPIAYPKPLTPLENWQRNDEHNVP
jgi:hypothetical protein